jgi:hypothetical protein
MAHDDYRESIHSKNFLGIEQQQASVEWFLCARHCFNCHVCMNSFNPDKSMGQESQLSSFYKEGN